LVIGQNLVQGEALCHIVEQGPIARLTLLQVPKEQIPWGDKAGLDDGLIDKVEWNDLQEMSNHIWGAIYAQVIGEGKLLGNGCCDGGNEKDQNLPVKILWVLDQESYGSKKDQANQVFAVDLEWGETNPCPKANRENLPVKDRSQDNPCWKPIGDECEAGKELPVKKDRS
jgi:hypothetical protein